MNALIPTTTTDIMSTAKALAESGYFSDAKSAAQAYVKVLAGAELGLPPFQSMNGIHIIQGKPVLGAGLIASVIKRSGKYNYRVVETTDKVCSIDFFEDGQPCGNSTITIEQAKRMQVKNLDKFPQNMLFARAISNGAKWFTPDVFGGPVYTEGEIEPIQVQDTTAVVVSEPAPPRKSKLEVAQSMQAQQAAGNAEEFVRGMIDEYQVNIERASDAASYLMLEENLLKEGGIPKPERGSLFIVLYGKMIDNITTAAEANAFQNRIGGLFKNEFIDQDAITNLLNALIEQAKANGVNRVDKKFVSAGFTPAEVEALS